MLEVENKNSSCGFAEDLVSYLYGEIGEAKKSVFERHLADCPSCADELAAFGVVRSSILDWKKEEFAPLATPAIEIPVSVPQAAVAPVSDRPWFASIRQLFTLSPALMKGATAFAALMVCVGLAYVAVSSLQKGTGDIAVVPKEKPLAAPTPPAGNGNSNKPIDVSVAPEKDKPEQPSKPAVSPKKEEPEVIKAVSPVEPKKSAPGALPSAPSANPRPASTQRVPKPADKRQAPQKRNSEIDLTGDEDEEDDGLRLADLFEEIGTE